MEVAVLALAGSATALATGLGAIPVSRLGERAETIRPALWGLTVGLMAVASIVGLLLPALDEGSTASVVAGLVAGIVFLLASRRLLQDARRARRRAQRGRGAALGARLRRPARAQPARGLRDRHGLRVGDGGAGAVRDPRDRAPERAGGHERGDPDGGRGLPARQQFWAAVLTSAPQPVGALVAYALVQQIESLLPFSFAFAAGAMLCLVVVELAPEAFQRPTLSLSLAGTAAGALLMLVLAAVAGGLTRPSRAEPLRRSAPDALGGAARAGGQCRRTRGSRSRP